MKDITIPNNTLWQYLEKEHLDTDNKLTDKQWTKFVEDNQDYFSEKCSELGGDLCCEFIRKVGER